MKMRYTTPAMWRRKPAGTCLYLICSRPLRTCRPRLMTHCNYWQMMRNTGAICIFIDLFYFMRICTPKRPSIWRKRWIFIYRRFPVFASGRCRRQKHSECPPPRGNSAGRTRSPPRRLITSSSTMSCLRIPFSWKVSISTAIPLAGAAFFPQLKPARLQCRVTSESIVVCGRPAILESGANSISMRLPCTFPKIRLTPGVVGRSDVCLPRLSGSTQPVSVRNLNGAWFGSGHQVVSLPSKGLLHIRIVIIPALGLRDIAMC